MKIETGTVTILRISEVPRLDPNLKRICDAVREALTTLAAQQGVAA